MSVDDVLAAIDSAVCPFCALLAPDSTDPRSRELLYEWPGVVAFEPLGPIVPGHVLVVPREHVADAGTDPALTAAVMLRAAVLAQGRRWPCNIITSCGADATQSVFHLHVHVVPRRKGDGLKLPWTDQPASERQPRPPSDTGGTETTGAP